jgi:hypothetical protein
MIDNVLKIVLAQSMFGNMLDNLVRPKEIEEGHVLIPHTILHLGSL